MTDVKTYKTNHLDFQSLEIKVTCFLSIYRQAYQFKLIAQIRRMTSSGRFDDRGLLKEIRSGQKIHLRI